MKKYFVVSDVHSFYTELQCALSSAGFDVDNPEHILISCGDLLDRGYESINCLAFVNSLYSRGRAILIRGNHEDLLQEVFKCGEFSEYDYSNGTAQTVYDVANFCTSIGGKTDIINIARHSQVLNTYLSSLVDYAELNQYIFVHGWIPCNSSDKNMYHSRNIKYSYIPEWRNGNWEAARWINGMDAWNQGVVVPEKTIVCGHWHTSWGHHYIDKTSVEFPNKYSTDPAHRVADFSPFVHEGIIALDACTPVSHKINCITVCEQL